MSKSDGFILLLMLILMLILSLLSLTLFEAEQKHLAVLAMVEQNFKDQLKLLTQPDNTFYLRAIDPDTDEHYWQKETQGFKLTMRCDKENRCAVIGLHRIL